MFFKFKYPYLFDIKGTNVEGVYIKKTFARGVYIRNVLSYTSNVYTGGASIIDIYTEDTNTKDA